MTTQKKKPQNKPSVTPTVKRGPTMVSLINPNCSMKQAFEFRHAERILGMGIKANGGWELPSSSIYIFTRKNGLRIKSDKANPVKTDKTSVNTESK